MKNLLLPATLVLLVGLFTGCTKKTEPVAASGITYTLDGLQMTGTGTISIDHSALPSSTSAAGMPATDYLVVRAAIQGTNAQTILSLTFTKPAGHPNSEYKIYFIYIDRPFTLLRSDEYNAPNAATITKTASGNWSGTFSGTGSRNSVTGANPSYLTNGVFTELEE